MGRASSWAGWLVPGSRRIFRSGSQRTATTAPSRARTFAGTGGEAFTSAQQQGAAHHRHRARWQHASLSRLQVRLRCLCAQDAVLPQWPRAQSPRDVHEDARDVARRLMRTKAFLKSRDERKRVEMRFAHLKIHHGFERMRLRGLSGARDEFHLAAIVQNLKTLALRFLGPPPARPRASFA